MLKGGIHSLLSPLLDCAVVCRELIGERVYELWNMEMPSMDGNGRLGTKPRDSAS